MQLPLRQFMKIVLITNKDDSYAQKASVILEHALQQLCAQHGYECIVLSGQRLPGRFAFAQRAKQKKAVKQLQPSIVIYASPMNFLPVKDLRIMVLVNKAADDRVVRKAGAKITAVITDSTYLKKQIIQSSGIPASRVCPIQFFDEEYAAVPNLSSFREEHTSGKEYFFYSGSIDPEGQWERVLQAFSQFKKWQQSGLQLVLGGIIEEGYQNIFSEKLNAYKYRQDVITPNNAVENKKLIAAAFAVLSAAASFDERMDVINAFVSRVPVIAHDAAISRDLCGESALYANFKDARNLSQQLISIYKNEGIFNHLAEKGRLLASRFSRQQMLDELHRCLLAAAE